MTTRYALILIASLAVAQSAAAQAAPGTKAPATQEQPSLFTRLKRIVGLEKEPAPAPVTAPATDTTKPDTTKQATKAPATKTDTKGTTTKGTTTKGTTTKGAQPAAQPQGTQATKAAGTKAADTKAPATPDAKAAPAGTKAAPGGPAPRQGGLTIAPEVAQRNRAPAILREVYDYEAEGRRDPFFSLLTTSELRPALVDLRLTGVILDPSGRRSVAIMRDVKDNTQYRVTTGMTLGRMRVALIKARSVIFSIEEFGLNRQDSLVLGDTTKVRAK